MSEWPLDNLNEGRLSQYMPTAMIDDGVLFVGLERGILSAADVVKIKLRQLESGVLMSAVGEELALKLSDDLDDVLQVLRDQVGPTLVAAGKRAWLYVGTRAILERWQATPDPKLELAALIEEFDAPPPYDALLYYGSLQTFRERFGRISLKDAVHTVIESESERFAPPSGSPHQHFI